MIDIQMYELCTVLDLKTLFNSNFLLKLPLFCSNDDDDDNDDD